MRTRFLNNILWFVISLIAFIPMLVGTSVIYPFIMIKATAFRLLTVIAFSVLLFIMLSQRLERKAIFDFKRNKILVAWILLLVAFSLSAIFGVDAYNSFWSGSERMIGIISWISFLLFYLSLIYVMAGDQHKKRLFQYLVLACACIVSVSAILSYLGSPLLRAFKGQRLTGLSGNPAYLAIYMLFAAFLALSLAFEDYEKKSDKGFAFWLLGFLYFSIIVFGTGTRGVMLGWGIGIIGILLHLIFKYRKNWIGKLSLIIVIAGMVSVGVLFILKNTAFVKNNLAFSRLTSISAKDTTIRSRLFSYKTALKAWPEKPIFGWGLENYKPAFLHNFIPEMYNNNPSDVSFDKAHNMPLEILTTTGIFGLTVYLYFFYIATRSLKEKVDKDEITPIVAMILGFGFLGYFVSNFFLFDVFESLFMMTIFLALFTPSGKLTIDKSNYIPSKYYPFITNIGRFLLLILIMPVIYLWIFLPYETGCNFAQAKKFCLNGNIVNAYAYLQAGLARETLSSRDGISDFLKQYINNRNNLATADKLRFDVLIKSNLETLMKKHPTSLDMPDNLVFFLMNRPDASIEDILEAKALETKLSTYAPNYLSYRINLAFIDGLTNDYDNAIKEINYVLERTNQLAQPYWYKGLILNMKSDKAEALDNFAIAVQKGYGPSINELLVLIQQALNAKHYDYLVIFYTKAIELNPQNLQNYVSLAAAYQKIGDYNNARRIAQKMLELNPSLKPQVDAFLKTLPLK